RAEGSARDAADGEAVIGELRDLIRDRRERRGSPVRRADAPALGRHDNDRNRAARWMERDGAAIPIVERSFELRPLEHGTGGADHVVVCPAADQTTT